jgi:hypothetical protein
VRFVNAYQAFAALRVVLVLLLGAVFAWLAVGRPLTPRLRAAVFVLLAAAAVAYPNFGVFHPNHYRHIHYWDVYHYFIGAKYFPELGYSRLYEATYVAGRELGAFGGVRALRDLTTYRFRDPATVDADAVRGRFTPQRWQAFKRDLAVIGNRIKEWPGPLLDRGYNDPPPRALLLHLLVRWVPATPVTLTLLTSIDYALVLGALVAVWRAFGPIPTALAFASLWLSFFARFDFIGGSLLRWDWIAALLLGVAALARGAGVTAGVCLAYAALARIFPILFLLPLAIKMAGRRPPDAGVVRTLGAAAAVIIVVVGLVAAAGEDRTSAREYLAKIRLHSQEVAANSVGLGSLLVFHAAPWTVNPDGSVQVMDAAVAAAAPSPWLVRTVAAVYMLLAVPLIRRATPVTSLMYVVPLIFWALSPTGYYYSFLVLLVLLPWQGGLPDRVRLLEMVLLTAVMAAIHAFEVASADLIPLYYQASIALGVFFVLWLGFEYARLAGAGEAVTPPARLR